MKHLILVILVGLMLVACNQSGLVKKDTASTLYLPPTGTLIDLKNPLTVPSGHARLFLQKGKVMTKQGIDQYAPSCNFEIRSLSEQPQTISPETFLVVKVQRVTEEVVQFTKPVQLAGRGFAGMDADGSLPMVVRGVHLWVGSDIQPDVMRVTCRGAFADAWRAELPSIEQMRSAFGNYASINLP